MGLCLVAKRNSVFKEERQKSSVFRVFFPLPLALPLTETFAVLRRLEPGSKCRDRHYSMDTLSASPDVPCYSGFLFERRNKRKFLLPLERDATSDCHSPKSPQSSLDRNSFLYEAQE